MRLTLPSGCRPARLAMGLVLGFSLFGATSSAAANAPLGLSVHIDDSVTEVEPAQEVVYSSELRNSGPAAIEATVVVTVPDYLEVTSVAGDDVEGSIDDGTVSWAVSVDPGDTVALVTTARVGTIPTGERRVTTIVSVYLGPPTTEDRGAPLIRSADSNRIVGVDDSGLRTDVSTVQSSDTPAVTILLVSAGGVCVLLCAAAVFFLQYRRRR